MTTAGIFRHSVKAAILGGLALAFAVPCAAEPTEDKDFAALQAETKKTFQEKVTPFVKTYCFQSHGDKKTQGGINFAPGLYNPGAPSSRKRWKQALANVKTHDMPPEDAKQQPTDEERQMFVDWIGQI